MFLAATVLAASLGVTGECGAAIVKVPIGRFREAIRPLGTGGALVFPGRVTYSASAPTLWMGWYKVRLPAGTRLAGASYYHQGGGTCTGTAMFLVRSRFGETPETVASGSSTDPGTDVLEVPLTWTLGRKLRAGYDYYLFLNVGDGCSANGAKIAY